MGALAGRTAIITGAGRGLGRAHALCLAGEGANVIVNDFGDDGASAAEVVAEIIAAGGAAMANTDDVADWSGAERLIQTAIDAYGDLDILVNNAGILRDSALAKMSEQDWDAVITVHLKGHFAPTRWAGAYWREQSKAGSTRPRSIVHTSSTSGLFGNPGQSNYAAAKSGIATFSQICAQELSRYGVRSNCIVPVARTRLTMAAPGLADLMKPQVGTFDTWDPANVSPLVAYLATADCPFNGETFSVVGGDVTRVNPWSLGASIHQNERWTVDGLAAALPSLGE